MAINTIALDNFNKNIKSSKDLMDLYLIIVDQMPLIAIEAQEILRSSIALSVSALDNFFHDYYRTEIVEAYLGVGSLSVQFEKIKISIDGLKKVDNSVSLNEKRNYLNHELRKIQKIDSYQSPKSIENLFVGLGLKNVWSKIEDLGILNMKSQDIKAELANIVDRRNKIVHESDWDFLNDRKYRIEHTDANDVYDFINLLVKSIHNLQLN